MKPALFIGKIELISLRPAPPRVGADLMLCLHSLKNPDSRRQRQKYSRGLIFLQVVEND
jgi:hypothetical protein